MALIFQFTQSDHAFHTIERKIGITVSPSYLT